MELVYLLKQALGVWLGIGLTEALIDVPGETAAHPLDEVWLLLFMPLLIAGLCVILQTAPRDFLWACACCCSRMAVSGWAAPLVTPTSEP